MPARQATCPLVRLAPRKTVTPAGPSPAARRPLENSTRQAAPPYFQLAFQRPLAPGDFPSPHPLQTGKSSGARGRLAFWSASSRLACALPFRACALVVSRLSHGLVPRPAQPSGAIGHCRALPALAAFSIAASSPCCGHVGKSFVCAPVCRKFSTIFTVENCPFFAA